MRRKPLIHRLQLTLSFSGTNDVFAFIFPEDWNVRPASGSLGSSDLFDMANSTGLYTQVFTFNAGNLDLFGSIVQNRNFGLWFSDQAFGANSFSLYSARPDVIGTPSATVPEPSALALAGLGWSRRRAPRAALMRT